MRRGRGPDAPPVPDPLVPLDVGGLTWRCCQSAFAAHVARSHTNKQVGAELLLTAKAVDYHLGHIFAKPGVNNRRALRGLRSTP